MRKSYRIIAVVLAGSTAVVALWHVREARLRANEQVIVSFYQVIDVGMSRDTVAALRDRAAPPNLKCTQGADWERYYVGLLDDSLLYVRYTSNQVDFVGIVTNDVLTNKPNKAPPWKRRTGAELPY